ncbi:hypothetical protein G9A89_020854 [Geosiphon pyriformis]|nr:hypothetical protein G9A89_020854 [Geosiphon pyriformis]
MAFFYIIVLIVAFYFYKIKSSKAKIYDGKQLPVPPGAIPVFGHLFLLRSNMAQKFVEWRETCGDIFMIYFGPMRWIILNNVQVVDDLLLKRGAIYSSHPSQYLFNLLRRNKGFSSSPYNEWYRKMTPLVHDFLNQRKVESYSSLIAECTHDLVLMILKDTNNKPKGINPSHYLHFTSFNIIVNVIFGIKFENLQDPLYKQLVQFFNTTFELATLKTLFANNYPILYSFPPFRKEYLKTLKLREEWEAVTRGLLKRVENDPEKKPCVARDFLMRQDEGLMDELDVIKLCELFLIAGTETVSNNIGWLIANLANNPEFQKKAHEELDIAVGDKRLPTTSDFSSLLYIQSLIKETLRWAPPVRAVFRYLEQDDTYMGYQIPKNSRIVLNIYALNSDKNRYKNPDIFNPDRFMDSKEVFAISAKGSYKTRDHYTFSVGRRTCTGIYLAELELLYLSSMLLWAFKIENANQDSMGKSIPIDLSTSPESIFQFPKPYFVRFIPRHPEIETMLSNKISQDHKAFIVISAVLYYAIEKALNQHLIEKNVFSERLQTFDGYPVQDNDVKDLHVKFQVIPV